jgi:adenylate cyclase
VVRVCFAETRLGPSRSAEAEAGDAMMDLCDEARAPVAFSCRDANCGTCLVQVIEGLDLLDEPGRAERVVLETLGVGADHRLACRARIAGATGLVRVRFRSGA